MNDKTENYKVELVLNQCGVNGYTFEYYKFALKLANYYPESLNQIIKYIYYPMSLYFCQTMSNIERTMREAVPQLYMGAPQIFKEKGIRPTVSEALGALRDIENNDNC